MVLRDVVTIAMGVVGVLLVVFNRALGVESLRSPSRVFTRDRSDVPSLPAKRLVWNRGVFVLVGVVFIGVGVHAVVSVLA